MDPEWSDFKVLQARAGSVAGAARELQVDHSTVSRRLAALEEALGAKLAIRGGRDFNWTAKGRSMLAAAEAMQSAAAQATRSVRSAKAEVKGTVRVSFPPGLVPYAIRLMLPALRERHPGLARHPLVLYAESMLTNAPLRWLETYKDAAPQVSRFDNLEIVCQATAADAGIAVLPCLIGDPVASLERVFPEPVSVNTAWIVYHDETVRDSARVRTVVEALVAFFEHNAALLTGVIATRDEAPT